MSTLALGSPVKPARVDLALLRILTESDAWVQPHDAESHPVVLAFYVPAHLAGDLKKRLSLHHPPRPPDGGEGRPGTPLRLLK